MKIGIITICKVNNYGAELQAFALVEALRQMGYDAEIIDYTYYKNWYFKDSKKSKPFVSLSIKNKILYLLKYRAVGWLVDKVLPIINSNVRKRRDNYNSFLNFCHFSSEYKSIDELYGKCGIYDAYIVGSDQVWNPSSSSSIEPYFLTFAPDDKRRISYASSFGVSDIDMSLQEKYKALLDNIEYISVREQSGVELVRKLTGRDAYWVSDPTLLLNKAQWTSYMHPVPDVPKDYVLVYQLLPSDSLLNIAKELSAKMNVPVYAITKRGYAVDKISGINNLLSAGPSEFLWLIANAKCVVTNSFHGTAFSVNFSTPFCCVLNRNRKNNDRMVSLLSYTGLEDRIVYEDSDLINFDNFLAGFDNGKLDGFRERSCEYLKNALNIKD